MIAETKFPRVNGQEMVLWGKANILYDTAGRKVGAIESIRDITERIEAENQLKQSYDNLQLTLEGTVKALSATTEKKDPYTAGHQARVAGLACAIGEQMGLDRDQIEIIRIAGTVHDIGKIHIPNDIINKPGRINEIERAYIKTHSQVGYDILKTIPFDKPVAATVLQHHERLDGSGYPAGLIGEQITLEARIIAVADVVEAMASHRPYRPALGVKAALDEIVNHRGTLYDPDVVDACWAIFQKGYVL